MYTITLVLLVLSLLASFFGLLVGINSLLSRRDGSASMGIALALCGIMPGAVYIFLFLKLWEGLWDPILILVVSIIIGLPTFFIRRKWLAEQRRRSI